MFHRNLYISILLRLTLIILNIVVFVWGYFKQFDYLSLANLGALFLIQVYLLVRKLNQVNDLLANFFASIKNKDTSLILGNRSDQASLKRLHKEMSGIYQDIRKERLQNEYQVQYLEKMLNHAGSGMIVINRAEEIQYMNRYARTTLQLKLNERLYHLNELPKELSKAITEMKVGEKRLIVLENNQALSKLLLHATEMKVDNSIRKIISFQNIRFELEQSELDSYQKLIRILTHEIMNSIAPIQSSIKVLQSLWKQEQEVNSSPNVEHSLRGLDIINERSEGLSHFVQNYRELTRLPKPHFQTINPKELIENSLYLLRPQLEEANVDCELRSLPVPNLLLDRDLISQVLINLLKNALEAMTMAKEKSLVINLFENSEKQVCISIQDSGMGIKPELKEQLFVPFFTTKESGNGIGLSLAQQIMRLHAGSISIHSQEEEGTKVELVF